MNNNPFAGIAISRRHLAIAIFQGHQLHHVIQRHVSSDIDQAERTVIELTRRTIEKFHLTSVAIREPKYPDGRTAFIYSILNALFLESAVSMRAVDNQTLFTAFALPQLHHKNDLRETILRIWPALTEQKVDALGLDAVAVGLFAQLQRFLNINLYNLDRTA